jgi:hypothetical protein
LSTIKGYYKLSLGRIYHELFYIVEDSSTPNNNQDYIKVEIHVPFQYMNKITKKINYDYRFQVPDSTRYDISHCDIGRKDIELVKWNLIDSYICIQGNGSLKIDELQKFWRQRIYMIPCIADPLKIMQATKNLSNQKQQQQQQQQQQLEEEIVETNLPLTPASLVENKPPPIRCDVYQSKSYDEMRFFRDHLFIRFLELLNHLKRIDERRRIISKATQTYLEMNTFDKGSSSSNSLNQNININTNIISAGGGVGSLINLPSSSSSSGQMMNQESLLNRSFSSGGGQLSSAINLKQQQHNQQQNRQNISFEKLVSPKVYLYKIMESYLKELDKLVLNLLLFFFNFKLFINLISIIQKVRRRGRENGKVKKDNKTRNNNR